MSKSSNSMERNPVAATNLYIGHTCYLCNRVIHLGEIVNYYNGPFIMHEACIQKILLERSVQADD